MYQILVHEYGNETPKGMEKKTTKEVEDYVHKLSFKSLVYLEVRYVRAIDSPVDNPGTGPTLKAVK